MTTADLSLTDLSLREFPDSAVTLTEEGDFVSERFMDEFIEELGTLRSVFPAGVTTDMVEKAKIYGAARTVGLIGWTGQGTLRGFYLTNQARRVLDSDVACATVEGRRVTLKSGEFRDILVEQRWFIPVADSDVDPTPSEVRETLRAFIEQGYSEEVVADLNRHGSRLG